MRSRTKEIAISALTIAIYVIIMYLTQGFAFGQFQIRIATGLYALAYHYHYLIIPFGIANLISNTLMGGLGIFDIVGGCIVGIIASALMVLMRKVNAPLIISVLPVALTSSLLVPIWLGNILNIPYIPLFLSILLGQTISAYTLGIFIVKNKKVFK